MNKVKEKVRESAASALLLILGLGTFSTLAAEENFPKATSSLSNLGREIPHASIRVDTTLVLVNVTVTDQFNRFVIGLEKEQFKVTDDEVEQHVTQFFRDDAPLSIGLVFDCSASMRSKLGKARRAAEQFLKTANPADEFFLVAFSDRPALITGFTTNTKKIQSHLIFSTQARGGTALFDALRMALLHMKNAHNPRRAVMLISDGGDNQSRYTEYEIRKLVRETNVQIYAIGMNGATGSRARTVEELSGSALLTDLADQTGGRHYEVDNLQELPGVAAAIGTALRNQYVLGYTPTYFEKDGRYHRLKVVSRQPAGVPLNVIFRPGYYAPAQRIPASPSAAATRN